MHQSCKTMALILGISLGLLMAVTSSLGAVHGKALVFRWSLLTQSGVRGFNLYAGTHKVNAHRIPTHRSLAHRATIPSKSGRPAIRATSF
ncbi:MAG: hypothetical protein NVS4B2_29850 [Chloroflexota bacterium]